MKNERTLGLKKQFVAAIAMLLVAALALGTATWAWFANNDEVTGKGITVNAVADSSILIKGSQDSSYGVIGTNNDTNKYLLPCSSVDGITFGTIDSAKVESPDSATVDSWKNGTVADGDVKTAEKDKNYLETTYSLKYVGKPDGEGKIANADVYVSSISAAVSGEGKTNALNKAIRVSVTLKDETKNKDVTYLYNPNTGSYITYSSTAKALALESSKWGLKNVTTNDINSKTTCWSIKGGATETAATAYTATVRIWFEGQDTACITNNISTDDLDVTIKFKKAAV